MRAETFSNILQLSISRILSVEKAGPHKFGNTGTVVSKRYFISDFIYAAEFVTYKRFSEPFSLHCKFKELRRNFIKYLR